MKTLIFAKFGTTERVAIATGASSGTFSFLQKQLRLQLGGEWVAVNELKINDCVHFDSGVIYEGFIGGDHDDNYCGSSFFNLKLDSVV